MALYRCAACGSPRVVTDEQTGGISFDYKKGIAGTIVLGAGGAVAGIQNQTEHVFKCPDCGISLSYSMPDEIKRAIDAGVQNLDARDQLTLYGVHVPWHFFTQKYCNIEQGPADEALKENGNHAAQLQQIHSQTNHFIAQAIINKLESLQVELGLSEHFDERFDELQIAWEATTKETLQARQEAYEQTHHEILCASQEAITKIEQDTQSQITELKTSCSALCNEKAELEKELSSLGLFSGKRKKEVRAKLEQIEAKLTENNHAELQLTQSLHAAKDQLLQEMKQKEAARKAEVDKNYPIPESPAEHKKKLSEFQAFLTKFQSLSTDIEKRRAAANLITYLFIDQMQISSQTRISFVLNSSDVSTKDNFETYCLSDLVEIFQLLKKQLYEILHFNESYDNAVNQQVFMLSLKLLSDSGKISTEKIAFKNWYYIPR